MTIAQYFIFLAFATLWCNGVFGITRKGQIFDFIDQFFRLITRADAIEHLRKTDMGDGEKLSVVDSILEKFYKPIIGCVTCMASVHTLYLYFFYCCFTGNEFVFWIWCAIAIPTSFLNELIWSIRSAVVNFSKALNEDRKEKD